MEVSPNRKNSAASFIESLRPSQHIACILIWLLAGQSTMSRVIWGDEPAGSKPITVISAAQMQKHVEFLASKQMAGRSGDSKALARKYIIEQWMKSGLRPLFATETLESDDSGTRTQDFEQPIPGSAVDNEMPETVGHNLAAWLPGSDPVIASEIVILSAHYDHLGVREGHIYPGADDNASSVAMLIEAARQLASEKTSPRRSIVFIAFDLEERLLWGSRWFAAHPPWPLERVKLFVTADMIGRSLGDLPLPAVFVMGSERAPELGKVLDSVNIPRGLEVFRLGADIVGTRSDYGPFRDRQIPFLFFSTGEHPDYHTPNDTPDKINYEKASQIASLILDVSRQVANTNQPPDWNPIEIRSLEEPKVLYRITNLLLEADQKKPLTSTQRFLVTNVKNRCQKILTANSMTSEDRAWLVRMSQLLLVSVF